MFRKLIFPLISILGIQISVFAQSTTINNVKVGENIHGEQWGGLWHKEAPLNTGYALLQNSLGTYTLLNKETGNGHIGFRVQNSDKMVVANNGNVGIGIASPQALLHTLNGNSPNYLRLGYNAAAENNTGEISGILFTKHYDTRVCAKIYTYSDWNINAYQGADIRFATGVIYEQPTYDRMVISSNGNVGIGTMKPNSLLAVNGKVTAKEVQVTVNGWSDYVFDKDYKLRPLIEVENYIEANHHLPEIPSATEVEKEGLNLGKMDALLLKKIEELTLYMIELKKESQNLQELNSTLKQEVETLKTIILDK
jgi:hypothetical protein